ILQPLLARGKAFVEAGEQLYQLDTFEIREERTTLYLHPHQLLHSIPLFQSVHPLDGNRAAIWLCESFQTRKCRRFACPVWTQETKTFPSVDGQRQAVDCLDLAIGEM